MKYNKWTDEDKELIVLMTEDGYTAREIAEALNRSEDSVKQYKVKLGLSKKLGSNKPKPLDDFIPELTALNIECIGYEGVKGQSIFKCLKCNREWKSRMSDTIRREQACVACSIANGSKIGNEWLNSLNISVREFKVPGTIFVADGYDSSTNTLYEFLGDFWHGNLEVFNPDDLNTKVGMTFEDLAINTMNRLRKLADLGYKIVYIWEHDYKLGRSASQFTQ